MKLSILTLALVASTSMAQTVNGTVKDHYKEVHRQVPITRQVCNDVQVPVQGTRSEPSGGGVLLGAIVGNAIGAATGITDGRTLGTFIGGVAGAEMSREDRVDHYRTEQRCQNVTSYITESTTVYSYSTITFVENGRSYTISFKK